MSNIHPTAIIGKNVKLGNDVSVGPYCVLNGEISIGDGTQLMSHVVIGGRTTIGKNCTIFSFASLGSAPQDLKYKGEPSQLIIGDDNVIREYVTMNPGTEGGGMLTQVGNHCLFMVGSHVAHDCKLGDHVILANNATLAGHVQVADHVIIGGLAAVHQFVRIGPHAVIGGMSGVEHDVIPFGSVMGERANLAGLNLVGLKRRGFERDAIHALRNAYKMLFEEEEGTLVERAERVRKEFSGVAEVEQMLSFMDDKGSRSLCVPKMFRGGKRYAGGMSAPTLGIIACGGRLPLQLVEACQVSQRPYFVLGFEGITDAEAIAHLPHAIVRLGAAGEALEHLRKAGTQDLVLAGNMRRPSFTSLRPDVTGVKLLARLGRAIFSGDDALLKAVIAFFEDEGFNVIGADDVLGALIAPLGILGKIKPDARARADIAQGMRVAKQLGALDVGQAAIVENGYVLGVEAAEGTDALIERAGKVRREKGSGVLVKAKKPGQEKRADLPAIGPQTVERIHAAGFAGIAVEAGSSLILDKEKTIAKADELGIFVVGVRDE